MKLARILSNLQQKLEERINALIHRFFPSAEPKVLRLYWQAFYAVFGLCWLGGALLSCLATTMLTIGAYMLLESHFPAVTVDELASTARVGQKVCFEINELTGHDSIQPDGCNYRIPAIEYAYKLSKHLSSGNIRMKFPDSHLSPFWLICSDIEEKEHEKQLRAALQAQGLSNEDMQEQMRNFLHTYTPQHITGHFLAEGLLTAPNEVLLHRIRPMTAMHQTEDLSPTDQAVIVVSLTSITISLVLIGTWGWIWCLRSLLRIRGNGSYQAPSSLLATALLQGGSLVVLSYLTGCAIFSIMPTSYTIAPYNLQPTLQFSLSIALVVGFQLVCYRLRQPTPRQKTAD